MPESKETLSQHRRWLKTRFSFGRKRLDYSVISKQDASLQETTGYDAIASRSSYIAIVDPDRDLRWTLFVFSGLALFAAFRANTNPLLLFALYGGLMLVVVLVLTASRKLRSVAYTAIPAGGFNILVLEDGQHDAIVKRLEASRAEALNRDLASSDGITLRTYLLRLRWLVETGALSRDAFLQRAATLMPDENRDLLPEQQTIALPQTFTQRRLATRVDVSLEATHFIYDRRSWLNGNERFCVEYRSLRAPAAHEETDRQVELSGILLLWAGTVVTAWGGWINQSHPAGYYVGGTGLQRALIDFGPVLLFAIAAAAVIPWLTQLRIARPWPGVPLIRDGGYDAIVSAITDRRIRALRALARPDPLLRPQEQVQLLDELLDAEILSDEDHARAVDLAELSFGNPALDEPIGTEKGASDRVLH